MKVTGIGGIFFKAKDPVALNAWYTKYFGVNNSNVNYDSWTQQQGPTVFALFAQDSDYFGSKSQQFMINFRVEDIDSLIMVLKSDAVMIIKEVEDQESVGRFASVEDPEGNRIELWEPQSDLKKV